jgi:tripartite-type tricarboxylate transporter receptor subunit TctC
MTHALHSRRRQLLGAAAGLSIGGVLSRPVSAQTTTWPDKPVRIILGYPPGGAADGAARPLEPRMQALLGQPLVFDYKPGAGATLAAGLAAKAAPGATVQAMAGKPCPECGNATMIHKDGCDFCTACGYVGQCG